MAKIDKYNAQREEDLRKFLDDHKEVFKQNSHLSLQELADYLNRNRITTRKGGKWSKSTVARVLDALDISRNRQVGRRW